MNDTLQTIVVTVGAVLGVAIICSAATYGCTTNNTAYYKAFSECVTAGGSVVPDGPGAVCIKK